MAKTKIDYKKKLQTQSIIITALAIIIFVLVAVSSTAAWYIATKTDTADIVLGNAVMPRITSFNKIIGEDDPLYDIHSSTQSLLGNTRVFPGDEITMSLGFVLGDDNITSSPAYVRVKLNILYENINTGETGHITEFNSSVGKTDEPLTDENGNPTRSDALIEYNHSIMSGNGWAWKEVDFNLGEEDKDGKPLPADYWYVLQDTSTGASKIVYDNDKYNFLDGTIELSEYNITNKYANCKFHINYIVEAIQIANVQDPILQENETPENRTNPWWLDQDIYFDQDVNTGA